MLNIPTFENVEKPNKTTTCQTLVEKSTQKTSLSFQKNMMKNNFFVIFLLVHNTRKLPNIKYKEKAFFFSCSDLYTARAIPDLIFD